MKPGDELVSLLRDPNVSLVRIDWSRLVASIAGGGDLLECSRHPLGFLHVELSPLFNLAPNERLRLHYWPTAGANADSIGSLHDHVWNLASVVAAGSLLDRTFTPVASIDGEYEGTRVFYGQGANQFLTDGFYDLHFERELTIGPNQVYRVPSRTVHDSSVVTAPAVTFVLAQDDEAAAHFGPLILQRRDLEGKGTAVRETFDLDEALRLVASELVGHGGPS